MDFQELDTIHSLVAISSTLDTVSVHGRENIAAMDGCFRAIDALVRKLSIEQAEKEVAAGSQDDGPETTKNESGKELRGKELHT